jgi:hypothetical protein
MNRMIRYQRVCRTEFAGLIAAGIMIAYNIAAFIWFFYNLTPQNKDSFQWMAALVAICMLGLGVVHLIVLYALWRDIRYGGRPSILRSLTISLGVVSLIMLMGDVALLSDIGKETVAGLPYQGIQSEWFLVFGNNGLRVIFLVLAAVLLGITRRRTRAGMPEEDARDVAFITVHEVGFVSAILAVGAIVVAFVFPTLEPYRASLVWLFTAISIAPWALMLVVWFISRPRHETSWWDEKQVSDMGRASLFALPFVGIVLLVLLVISIGNPLMNIQALWFPVFIVAAVLGFSGLSAAFSRWG